MSTGKGRNISFDIMRVLAAAMVVYQHACGETVIEMSIESLTKIAVPLFLMITGYYYCDIVNRGRVKSQISKTLKYALVIVAVYFLMDFAHAILKHNATSYLLQYVNINNVIRFLAFNDPIPGDHSWYLWALLYVLIIVWAVPKLLKHTKLATVISLALLFCVGKYSTFIFGNSLEYFYCRNFLAAGMPFFLIGHILRDSEQIIRENKSIWKYAIIIFSIASILEYLIYSSMGITASGYYISTVLLAVSVFCYFQTKQWSQAYNRIANFGRKYVFYIYLVHVEFVVIEKKFLPMNNGMGLIGFFCVLAASIVLSVLIANCLDYVTGLTARRKI